MTQKKQQQQQQPTKNEEKPNQSVEQTDWQRHPLAPESQVQTP